MVDESTKTVASAQCEVLHFCEQITNMFDKVVGNNREQITDIDEAGHITIKAERASA